jgi:hypothetical protein
MPSRLRRQATYANLASSLALFLAVGGGAVYAASDKVDSQDIAKRAVNTKHLADDAVRSEQIRNGQVNSGDIRDQNVTGNDVAEGTLEGSDLSDGTVKGGKIGDESLTGADIQNGTLSGADVLDGSLTGTDIQNGSVGSQDLAPGTIPPPVDPFLTQVPSGRTVRGAIGGDFQAAGAAEDFGAIASMPIPAANPLSDDNVFINVDGWKESPGSGQTKPETGDTSPGCSGDPDTPTAPANTVCIYVAGGDNATDVNGFSVRPGTDASPYGFKIGWTSASAGDTFVDAVWAYTAP